MKKYILFNNDGQKEMDKEEYTQWFFSTIHEHILKNIEYDFNHKRQEITYKLKGKVSKGHQKKQHCCLCKDCNEAPIYSHSISKKSVLTSIAKDGFLYVPSIDTDKDKCFMTKIGISDASVFPGFCFQHDNDLFPKLDNVDNKDFDNDFLSQLGIRTLSYEISHIKRTISSLEDLLNNLSLGYEASTSSFLQKFNNEFYSKKVSYTGFRCSESSINKIKPTILERIENAKGYFLFLNQEFLNNGNVIGQGVAIEEIIPIAFSGLCSIQLENHVASILINCLPYKTRTIVSLHFSERDADSIQSFLSAFDLTDENSLLRLIETLAVRGTRNLFFNIDYWNSLETHIQNMFLCDFKNIEKSCINEAIDYTFLTWNWNNKESTK